MILLWVFLGQFCYGFSYSMQPSRTIAPGVSMPLASFGSGTLTGETAYNTTLLALSIGYRGIDTANQYRNQQAIGRAILTYVAADSKHSRDDIFITTKVEGGLNRSATAQTLNENLRLLNTSQVDLVLIHYPKACTLSACGSVLSLRDTIVQQWSALEDFFDQGSARAIGVSQFCPLCLEHLLSSPSLRHSPVINQVQQVLFCVLWV
jgi:diketogulonate reductase-like aldo/keto reductase